MATKWNAVSFFCRVAQDLVAQWVFGADTPLLDCRSVKITRSVLEKQPNFAKTGSGQAYRREIWIKNDVSAGQHFQTTCDNLKETLDTDCVKIAGADFYQVKKIEFCVWNAADSDLTVLLLYCVFFFPPEEGVNLPRQARDTMLARTTHQNDVFLTVFLPGTVSARCWCVCA